MSCEVASYGFQSLFESSPQHRTFGHSIDITDLSTIADFNAGFDTAGLGRNNDGSLNRRLTLSDPGSPVNNPNLFLQNTTNSNTGLNQTLAPSPEPIFEYPDLASAPTSPYFSSVEPQHQHQQQDQQPFHASPLCNQYLATTNQHRRSVTEPPDAFLPHRNPHNQLLHHNHQLHHQRQQRQHQHEELPPVVFHRDGHSLGTPTKKHPFPQALKGQSKAKHARHAGQAYVRAGNGGGPARRELRRAQTQPQTLMGMSPGPTSAPAGPGMRIQPAGMGYGMQWHPSSPMRSEPVPSGMQHPGAGKQFVGSPGPAQQQQQISSPSADGGNIDPMLTAMSTVAPVTPAAKAATLKVVTMKLGVEELTILIVEAVQKALREMDGMQGSKRARKGATVGEDPLACEGGQGDDTTAVEASVMIGGNGDGGEEEVVTELIDGKAQTAG